MKIPALKSFLAALFKIKYIKFSTIDQFYIFGITVAIEISKCNGMPGVAEGK
jgi:hypothetical protein